MIGIIQTFRTHWGSMLGAVLVLVAASALRGQQPAASEETAVREAGKAYLAALQRGDVAALTAAWTEQGTFIDAYGTSHPARAMIREQFGTGQGAPPAEGSAPGTEESVPSADQATVEFDSAIRFVSPEVAIEHGTTKVKTDPTTTPTAFTVVWVKQGGKWLLDSLREAHAATSPADHPLDRMRWMVGEWVGTGEGIVVSWAASWSENEKFLVRRFTIGREGGGQTTGTQFIGWDAVTNSVRSWTFNSDGSIDEGTWRNDQDSWIVKKTSNHPDGRQSRAVTFWVPEGEGRCVTKSSHIELEGTVLQDFVLEFARVSP